VGLVLTAKSAISSIEAHLESNKVLTQLRPALEGVGFLVEKSGLKLPRPVLYGEEGKIAKSFNVDAFRSSDGTALEVEAGSAVYNNRVILDLMKFALSMDVSQGAILVPQRYVTPKQAWTDPYPEAVKLFDAIFANPERLSFPLDGLLLVGF
jgi:hypothetical protein